MEELHTLQQTVLSSKPNNKWRPILDLSSLNKSLKSEKFKMETSQSIRTSLQMGEWVTSKDFRDSSFHIPINPQSWVRLHFYLQGQSYQFKALPFGLSTAPMKFTMAVEEDKLIAQNKGIRIHQYLDNWSVRAPFNQTCLHHTQTLVALCQNLGWILNIEKSELEPKHIFDFIGYQFYLQGGQGQTHSGMLADLKLPRLIQWHLKKSLEDPGISKKGDPDPKISPPTLMAPRSQSLPSLPLHPLSHALQIFIGAWGAHYCGES